VDSGLSRFDSAIIGEGGTGDMYIKAGGTGTAASPTYTWTGDTDTGMYRATTNAIGFSTAGAERIRIAADGKVAIGIGVTGDVILDINIGGTNTDNLWLRCNTDWNAKMAFVENNVVKAGIEYDAGSNGIRMMTGGTNTTMFLADGGNVGIGISSPMLRLDCISGIRLLVPYPLQPTRF